jgi:Tol biopolymer transport system component
VLVHIGGPDGHLSLFQLGETKTEDSLIITPTIFRAPAYSPDGRRMLVAGENADGQPALLLTASRADGSEPKTIVEYTGVIAFAWSPDGQRIAYLVSALASGGVPGGHLTVVDPSGKKKPVELKDEAVYAFFWSPDSRSIAYFSKYVPPTAMLERARASSRNETRPALTLNVMDALRGDTRLLLAPLLPTEWFLRVIPFFDQYHQSLTIWSPDSRNLVISKYDEKDGDLQPGIFVVDASGKSEPRHIADGWVAFWSWK